MDEKFKEKLNKLVDQVAETTKDAADVAVDGGSVIWKEFLERAQKAQKEVNKIIDEAEKKIKGDGGSSI